MAFDETFDSAAEIPDLEADEPVAAVADEPGETAEEPTLDDLDDDTRTRVEAFYARQDEQRRANLREYGLDLNAEGRPLIADPQRFSGWAGTGPAPRAAQAPAPIAQPPVAAQPAEPEWEFDPLSATADDYRRLARREAEALLAPHLEENRRLQGLLQRGAESKAMTDLRATVEQRIPEIASALDHPDFEAAYREQLAQVPAELLENPVTIASLAAMVRAQLDPSRMPAPRDAQGRFAGPPGTAPVTEAQLRHQAARQSLGQTPPARGGGVQRNAPDPQAELGARLFRHIGGQLNPKEARGWEATPEAWERSGNVSYDAWLAAKEQQEAAAGRNGGRRR